MRSKYLQRTIDELKENNRKKKTKTLLNQLFVNRKLYYMNMCLKTNKRIDSNVQCLVDTGASNSLIHTDVVKRLGIPYEPCKMIICTATGDDSNSVKGIAHVNVKMKSTKNRLIDTCVNFIVTDKLNGLESIIGADFLMQRDNVSGVSSRN